MARRALAALLSLAAAVAVFGWAGAADDGAEAAAGRTVTSETLAAFLAEAGLEPKPAGGGLLRVEVAREGGTYFCDLSVSPQGQFVWITAPLDPLPAERPLPRKPLFDLLRANGTQGGFHFTLVGDRLVLARAVDNRALEPHLLSQEIRRFVEAARAGTPLWDVRGWKAAGEGR